MLKPFLKTLSLEPVLAVEPRLFEFDWIMQMLASSQGQLFRDDHPVTLQFFLDGVTQGKVDFEEFYQKLNGQKFSEFDYSARITNIQLFSPEVKNICLELWKQFGEPVTCNLYFTPKQNANCFSYHADHQEIFILHLWGEKRWFFPLENQLPIRGLAAEKFTFTEEQACQEIVLKPKSQLFIPHGLIHRAQIESKEISVHLTFSFHSPHYHEVWKLLIDSCLSLPQLNTLQFEKAQSADAEAIMRQFAQAVAGLDFHKLAQQFQEQAVKEEIVTLKKGRSYKKQTHMDND